MGSMDRWDVLLLAAAIYVAVVVLVRLMAEHRNRLTGELREQMERMQQQKSAKRPDRSRDRKDDAA